MSNVKPASGNRAAGCLQPASRTPPLKQKDSARSCLQKRGFERDPRRPKERSPPAAPEALLAFRVTKMLVMLRQGRMSPLWLLTGAFVFSQSLQMWRLTPEKSYVAGGTKSVTGTSQQLPDRESQEPREDESDQTSTF